MEFVTLDQINERAAATAVVIAPAAQQWKPASVQKHTRENPPDAEETNDEDLEILPTNELECRVYDNEHRKAIKRELGRTIKGAIILTVISIIMVLVLVWFIVDSFPPVLLIVWSTMTSILTLLGIIAWIWFCVRLKRARQVIQGYKSAQQSDNSAKSKSR